MEPVKRTWKGRGFYVYYPDIEKHSPFRRYSLNIFRQDDSPESVDKLMKDWKIKEIADREGLVVSFPNPPEGGWRPEDEREAELLFEIQGEVCNPTGEPMKVNEQGIPLFESMMSRWHLMNDTRYYIGIGEGGSMVYSMALRHPENVTAIACIGGDASDDILEKAVVAPMPAYLSGAPKKVTEYFIENANDATEKIREGKCSIYFNNINQLQMVCVNESEERADEFALIYEKVFKKLRRTNTGAHGDIEPRMAFEKDTFDYYINDTRLGDQGQTAHTWFVHVPKAVKGSAKKVPLMLFLHGGSDNPAEAAEMSKFHELGEKEGFITVYPWGSDSTSWNCNLEPGLKDDIAYLEALINFMKKNYPVEETRVYMSGFSNGAGETQVFAMAHPEMLAAICHIDSNWPGRRFGGCELKIEDVKAFVLGMERKKTYDYLMPVWYTYGTREPSYPVYRGCSQQHQYDYWKMYNHIPVKETPKQDNPDPTGCGVQGDTREQIRPSRVHPHHCYDVQRFYTKDGENLYNYVVMHDKGHEVAQMDATLGWNYVKHYARNPDGSLKRI